MNQKFTYSIITFGCKLNQYDSRALAQNFSAWKAEANNWRENSDPHSSDILIINSCSVTHRADSDARKAARYWRRQKPDLFIVITGCYPQVSASEISNALPEADLLIGNVNKYDPQIILNHFFQHRSRSKTDDENKNLNGHNLEINPALPNQESVDSARPVIAKETIDLLFKEKIALLVPTVHYAGHSRPFVKIQDGCNLRCTYCIVPYTRGHNRSVPTMEVIRHLSELSAAGFGEAVLTGIHLGMYGHDLNTNLYELLTNIEAAQIPIRIRLSSLDSNEINEALIQLIAGSKQIRPHLHIPLQSGSNAILKRMGRLYQRENFISCVQKIHAANADILIGTDIIVGFPGETEADYLETEDILKNQPISHAHIFSFSSRRGTPAAGYENKIPSTVIQSRHDQLVKIAKEKNQAFCRTQWGKKREAILLKYENGSNIRYQVLTDNYLEMPIEFNTEFAADKNRTPSAGENIVIYIKIDKNGRMIATAQLP